MSKTSVYIFSLTLLLTLGVSTPAVASEAVIEEVIVTAERRAENMQSVPVAITAFTGDQLDDQGIGC